MLKGRNLVVIPSGVRSGQASHDINSDVIEKYGRNPFWSQVRSGRCEYERNDYVNGGVVIPSGVRSGQADGGAMTKYGRNHGRNPFWSQVRSGTLRQRPR